MSVPIYKFFKKIIFLVMLTSLNLKYSSPFYTQVYCLLRVSIKLTQIQEKDYIKD